MKLGSYLLITASYLIVLLSSVNGIYQFYGNDIKPRGNHIPQGALRAWIDPMVLPSGRLEQYQVFVHDVPKDVKMVARLQIWRLKPGSKWSYLLVWEKRVQFTEGGFRRYLVNLSDAEKFAVEAGDRMGWTFESNVGIISYDNSPSHKTPYALFNDFPVVGKNKVFIFDSSLPGQFSVGVVLYKEIKFYQGALNVLSFSGSTYDNSVGTYMDKTLKLTSGIMSEIKFYANKVEASGDLDITFQVWRMVDEETYTLTWAKVYKLTQGSGRAYTLALDPADQPTVTDADYLGWSYNGQHSFVSSIYNTSADEGTTFKIDRVKDLIVSSNYEFPKTGTPSAHVVKVTVKVAKQMNFGKDEALVRDFSATAKVTRPLSNTHVDRSLKMRNGKLSKIYFNTKNNIEPNPSSFQIDFLVLEELVSDLSYKLIWIKTFTINGGYGQSYTVKIGANEQPSVNEKCYLGWRYKSNIAFISDVFNAGASHYRLQTTSLEIGKNYTFASFGFPRTHVIGGTIIEPVTGDEYIGMDNIDNHTASASGYDKDKGTYVDKTYKLNAGTLLEIQLYAHQLNPDKQTLSIDFSVWRESGTRLTLIWTKTFALKGGTNRAYSLKLDTSDQVKVEDGDFLGWTYKDTGFISSVSYTDGEFEGGTFRIDQVDNLQVGTAYLFPKVGAKTTHIVKTIINDINDDKWVTPRFIDPTRPATTTSLVPISPQPTSKPLPSWLPWAIIAMAVAVLIIVIVFVLLYLRDRNYRRTQYNVYDVRYMKGKGRQRDLQHRYDNADIMFPTNIGLSGYKHDLDYYHSDYPDNGEYENITISLNANNVRQIHNNPAFTAEAIIENNDNGYRDMRNGNIQGHRSNGYKHGAHSEEIEQVNHI